MSKLFIRSLILLSLLFGRRPQIIKAMELSRRTFLQTGAAAGMNVLASAASGAAPAAPAPPPKPLGIDSIRALQVRLQPLMEPKSKPEAGDWLANHPEKGQTFAEYMASRPNRPTKERSILYVQPVGDFSAPHLRILALTEKFMGLFFGLPVQRLAAVPHKDFPDSAQRAGPRDGSSQLLTGYILDSLLPKVARRDAFATLALSAMDLWPGEGWNFVFGQASFRQRVGVWSMARFGDPEKEAPVLLRRTIQTAIHETGHMFGIKHCIAWQCCMNGSNSLFESDRAPLDFCIECDAKLWWACSLQPAARYEALAAFCQENSLETEAERWKKLGAALAGAR